MGEATGRSAMKRDTSSVGGVLGERRRVHHVAEVVAQHPGRPARHDLLEPREEVDAGDHEDARAHRPAPRRPRRSSVQRTPIGAAASTAATRSSGRSLCCTLPRLAQQPVSTSRLVHATRKVPRSRQPSDRQRRRRRRRRPGADQHAGRGHLVEPGEEPHRPEQGRGLAGQIGVGPGGEAEQQEPGDADAQRPHPPGRLRARTASRRAARRARHGARPPHSSCSVRSGGGPPGRRLVHRLGRCARATTSTPRLAQRLRPTRRRSRRARPRSCPPSRG